MQYLTLRDVCQFKRGFSFEKKKHKNKGNPILKVLNIQNNRICEHGMIYFEKKDYSKDLSEYLVNPRDIVLTIQGASSGKLASNNLNYSLYLSSTVVKFVFDSKIINSRYLFHFLMSKDHEIHECVYGADPKRLDLEKLGKIQIILPEIEKQIKIANTLDNFWQLSEELQEELMLRKKQYEYYRDELLSFKQDNKIKWLTLGEIFKFIGGFPFEINKYKNDGLPILRINNICGSLIDNKNLVFFSKEDYEKNLDSYILKPNDLFITNAGTLKIGFNNDNINYWINQRIYKLNIKYKEVNWKYLFHWLTNNLYEISIETSSSNMVPNWSTMKMKKIKIPVPPLEKQKEIANLLDKFWELSNNINVGLPAEILLRKQQYEYYRESLLNQKNN